MLQCAMPFIFLFSLLFSSSFFFRLIFQHGKFFLLCCCEIDTLSKIDYSERLHLRSAVLVLMGHGWTGRGRKARQGKGNIEKGMTTGQVTTRRTTCRAGIIFVVE